MKRIAGFFSAAFLIALLAGCGGGSSKTESPVDGGIKPAGGEKDGTKAPTPPPPPPGAPGVGKKP